MLLPTGVSSRISMPIARSRSSSAFSKGRGNRKAGIPAASIRQRLEDRRAIAFLSKLVGTEEAGGAGADDGNLLRTLHLWFRQLVVGAVVGDEALQCRQIHGIVHVIARAGGGAGVGADAAADQRNRVVAQNDLERLLEAPSRDQSHISLPALMDGTSRLAGRGPAARDGGD